LIFAPAQRLDIKQDHDRHVRIIVTGSRADVDAKFQQMRRDGLKLSNLQQRLSAVSSVRKLF
jgi:hypothetical protein